MDVDLLFKIAAIGILVAVLHQVLCRAGREEQAMMTTLAGVVIVLTLVIKEIKDLLEKLIIETIIFLDEKKRGEIKDVYTLNKNNKTYINVLN